MTDKNYELENVTVLDGEWQADKPVIILDAETARLAFAEGALNDLILDALSALELSGKRVVFVEGEKP